MDLSTVTSINIGSTSVNSVYYQSQKIWPTTPDWFEQGDWIAFDVYVSLDDSDPLYNGSSVTEDQYKEIFGYDPYKGYLRLQAVDGSTYNDNPSPYFTTTEYGNCIRYYVRKGIESYIWMSDASGDITFQNGVLIGTVVSQDNSTYMDQIGWSWDGYSGHTIRGLFNCYNEDTFARNPAAYTITNTWNSSYAYIKYYHKATNTTVYCCINKANKNTFPDSIMLNPAGKYGYYVVGNDSSNGISNIANYSVTKEWFDQNCDIVDNMYQLTVYPRANNYIDTGDQIFAMSSTGVTPSITKTFPPSEGKLACTAEVINQTIRITNTGNQIPYGLSSQGILAMFDITFEGYSLGISLTVTYNYAMGYTDAPAFSEWQQSTGNGTATITDSQITITKFNSADASPVYFVADYTKLYYLCFSVSGIPDDAQVYLDTYQSSGIFREYIKNGENYLYLMIASSNVNIGFRCSKALSSANIVIKRLEVA